jgi:hypothetical protein
VFPQVIRPFVSLRTGAAFGLAEKRPAASERNETTNWDAMVLAYIPSENVVVKAGSPS